MKTLKRVILAINGADQVILVNNQLRHKSDFRLLTKIRRETIDRMIDGGYMIVKDGVVSLTPTAVVMMPRQEQIEWMTKHCVR